MSRELTSHKVNGLNEALQIEVVDEPGQGNACHEYEIRNLSIATNEGDEFPLICSISFQNGPIKEFGVNGISGEVLLAIVRDRLESFQSGQYACETNQQALGHVIAAMDSLHSRTKERVARNVEGTHSL